MQQRLEWQSLSGPGPELFERVMVPAIFRPWADDLVAAAAPGPGERVLDVACGTGIVASLAAQRVGGTGRVVGLDISPSMLAMARAAAPSAAIEAAAHTVLRPLVGADGLALPLEANVALAQG